MGKYQLAMLRFALKYPGWHGYASDRDTRRALRVLVGHGLLQLNQYRQFRLTPPRVDYQYRAEAGTT